MPASSRVALLLALPLVAVACGGPTTSPDAPPAALSVLVLGVPAPGTTIDPPPTLSPAYSAAAADLCAARLRDEGFAAIASGATTRAAPVHRPASAVGTEQALDVARHVDADLVVYVWVQRVELASGSGRVRAWGGVAIQDVDDGHVKAGMAGSVSDPTGARPSRSEGFDTILPDGDPRGAPALQDVFDRAIPLQLVGRP